MAKGREYIFGYQDLTFFSLGLEMNNFNSEKNHLYRKEAFVKVPNLKSIAVPF